MDCGLLLQMDIGHPTLHGVPFIDAYQHMPDLPDPAQCCKIYLMPGLWASVLIFGLRDDLVTEL